MNRNATILLVLAFIAATLAVAAHQHDQLVLIYIFKPLGTLLILFFALAYRSKIRLAYSRWICLGLLFSLVGDVLLIWPDKFFVAGLAAFFFTHLAYLTAFTRDAKFPANWLLWTVFLIIAAEDFRQLHARLPRGLGLPVALYAVALATMTAQAIGRSIRLRSFASKLAAIGAILFLLSDTLLAWNRFQKPIAAAPALILSLYYAAQFLIALSTSPSVPPPELMHSS